MPEYKFFEIILSSGQRINMKSIFHGAEDWYGKKVLLFETENSDTLRIGVNDIASFAEVSQKSMEAAESVQRQQKLKLHSAGGNH